MVEDARDAGITPIAAGGATHVGVADLVPATAQRPRTPATTRTSPPAASPTSTTRTGHDGAVGATVPARARSPPRTSTRRTLPGQFARAAPLCTVRHLDTSASIATPRRARPTPTSGRSCCRRQPGGAPAVVVESAAPASRRTRTSTTRRGGRRRRLARRRRCSRPDRTSSGTPPPTRPRAGRRRRCGTWRPPSRSNSRRRRPATGRRRHRCSSRATCSDLSAFMTTPTSANGARDAGQHAGPRRQGMEGVEGMSVLTPSAADVAAPERTAPGPARGVRSTGRGAAGDRAVPAPGGRARRGPADPAVPGDRLPQLLRRQRLDPTWVGCRNYVTLFTDPDFGQSLLNTLMWVAGTLLLPVLIGLLLAVLTNSVTLGERRPVQPGAALRAVRRGDGVVVDVPAARPTAR